MLRPQHFILCGNGSDRSEKDSQSSVNFIYLIAKDGEHFKIIYWPLVFLLLRAVSVCMSMSLSVCVHAPLHILTCILVHMCVCGGQMAALGVFVNHSPPYFETGPFMGPDAH